MISCILIKNSEQLSLAYTPGVAEPCLAIRNDYEQSFLLTCRWNLMEVITDGTAGLVSDEERTASYILPKAFDPRVGKTVAVAVAKAAVDSGVARVK